MKAYTVHKFFVCQITGSVFVEVSFQINEDLKVLLYPFSNADNANAYLRKEKRDWLLGCLEKFVQHKRHIIEVSNSEEKKKELTVCLDALIAYEKMETETICKKFVNGIKYFQSILPGPQNGSYQNSIDNLNEIKKFCETELTQKP